MPDLVVPALGESITEAVISRWHKNVGDQVEVDEPVLALETDKITVDLPAPSAGSLAEQKFAEGDTVRVGDVVGSISAGGEAQAAKPEDKAEAKPAAKPEAKPEAKAAAKASAMPTPSSPRGEGNGQAGRRMSPSMRRAQREGTTPPPVAADPAAAASTPTAAATPAAPPAGTAPARARPQVEQGKADPREDVVPMTPIRKRIAQRLVEAQQSSASLTTFNEVDMSKVMELRDRFKQEFVERHGVKLGFMSFFARAAVAALAEFPGLNAEVRGDSIVYKKHYDLGIAVQTDRGLMVPVLRDVDQLGFAEIEKGIGELAARGRAGKLALDDLVGATFTITNGGIFGSMLSTPLLNYPQTGILGMHNIVDRPVATGGTVHVRPIMYVALTYDHRVVDGREAVSFLVGIKQRIESPDRLLFDL